MCNKPFAAVVYRAQPEDKASVMAILKKTKFFRPEELKVAEEVFDDALSGGCEGDYQSFVARDGHKTIGWICFGPTPCTVGTFDIYWLVVSPESQNRGVGTSLVQYATTVIKNCKGRMIVVDTSGSQRYLSTRQFYEKLGYRKESCVEDFYSVGDDKIIYVKRV
jgi:ribosomal protein S18 acetylase RimI-like enzyme